MTDRPLPDGFTVRLDRTCHRVGDVLVGGSPGRLVRLQPAARRLLTGDRLVVTDRTSARLARYLLDAGLAQPAAAPPDAVPDRAGVTLVLPVKDRPGPLDRLLAALRAELPGLPVVVVDDGSADGGAGTAAAAARHGAEVLRHPARRGPAAARNTGLAAVRGPLVAFLDSDVLPEPGWLDELLAELADPAVGWVGPRIVALAGPGPRPGRTGAGLLARYEAVASSLDLGPDPAPVLPRGRVAYLPSAAGLARVEALRGLPVPGFDPALQVGEDVDLLWRLHEAGWRVRYRPSARVGHDHRTDPSGWLLRKAVYGSSAAPLAARHPGQVPPLAAPDWAAAACALLLLQRRWSTVAALAVAVRGAVRLARRVAPPSPAADDDRRTDDRRADDDRRAAYRLVARKLAPEALAGTGMQFGAALLRHWWPVALPAAVLSRRARRALLAAALLEALTDRRRRRADPADRPGPVSYPVLRRVDDLAYGAGVWWGAWREREAGPLLPLITHPDRPATAPSANGRPAATSGR